MQVIAKRDRYISQVSVLPVLYRGDLGTMGGSLGLQGIGYHAASNMSSCNSRNQLSLPSPHEGRAAQVAYIAPGRFCLRSFLKDL